MVAPLAGSIGEWELQEQYGTVPRAERFYRQQMSDRLNSRMRAFIAEQEMMFVATADASGDCDNTFRAGPPGFVQTLSEAELAWPEYRGNGVMASLGNISQNPRVGILFVDFFRNVIGLHVNGSARIMADADIRGEFPELPLDMVPGRRPERWVRVHVHEAYIHCAKHIPRLTKAGGDRAWGSDDVKRKGGDFFGVNAGQAEGEAPVTPAPRTAAATVPRPRHRWLRRRQMPETDKTP